MDVFLLYVLWVVMTFLSLWVAASVGFMAFGRFLEIEHSVGGIWSRTAILAGVWTVVRLVLGFIPVPFLPGLLGLLAIVIAANAVFHLDPDTYIRTAIFLFVVSLIASAIAVLLIGVLIGVLGLEGSIALLGGE